MNYSADPFWNHRLLRIKEAIDLAGTRGKGVNIAILDTGIDYYYTSLRDRFNQRNLGYNVVNRLKSGEPLDDLGHGTIVARILAGSDFGISPESTIYSVKISESGKYELEDIIVGLDWCLANNIDIVNMSFGGWRYNKEFHEKCQEISTSMVLVASAGNNQTGARFPASYHKEVISLQTFLFTGIPASRFLFLTFRTFSPG